MIVVEDRQVTAGADLLLTGLAWGDDCHDTGPPPSGEGELGVPVSDIDIVIRQGAEEWLVATGSADVDYEFTVTVELPQQLRPGRARIRVGWDGRTAWTQDTFVTVVEGPATGGTGGVTVATFGPPESSAPPSTALLPAASAPDATTTTTAAPATRRQPVEPDVGTRWPVVLAGIIVVVGIAAVLARRLPRTRR
jgi:hypothetical protein